MEKAYLHQIHPVLPVQNLLAALFFYVHKLGFEIAFADDPKVPTYAGLRRGDVEIHLRFQNTTKPLQTAIKPDLRIVTQNIESLYIEFEAKEILKEQIQIINTDWGTKEFTIYDLDKNALTFYSNL
ncbi:MULTISPECIES: glyoxalase/bleomycin resistance/extradiol dioxygenase family protein [Bizionia]|uniref:Glyoxalase/bleomycin resistance/extradiol dioxygenase family protein n=1 Tax=Bizionia algoritergicola TaxID=291187 RepID=A0A5D0QV11_9FLAO|nr:MULTISPECIES: glyoxalase/bleomycin resistance/extradiol dioxygenase family protein [Bizionia]OBX21599.1 bleomycin resistance protein [Bizionia sp. APA-3]TYB72044.1 glyoxalase/bleomycin resistance/extradiol dioxygenase family protein [Bizionia algoritergicola]